MLKDYFLLTLLNYRQDYKLGTGIPVRAQRVLMTPVVKARQIRRCDLFENFGEM